MWETLQRYRALPADARGLFCRAAFLGPLIGTSLRFRGYRKTRDWLQKRLNRTVIQTLDANESSARLDLACRMVRAAEHYSLYRATCLEQSMLLWYLLQEKGIAATIRIGVRKPAGKFEAHAWIERDGLALNQSDEQHRHYHAFDDQLTNPTSEKP